MRKKKHTAVSATSMPKGIAAGIAVSLCVTLIGAMILAWLVATERMGEQTVNAGCFVILVVAALLGAVISSGAIRDKRMLVSGISAGGYYLALLGMALVFGGKFEGLGTTALAILVGGGASLLLGLVGNKSGAHRHKFKRFR